VADWPQLLESKQRNMAGKPGVSQTHPVSGTKSPGWLKIKNWIWFHEPCSKEGDEEQILQSHQHISNTKSVSRLSLIMFYSDSITKVRGIMARYIRASVHKDKRCIYDDLTVEEYEKADYMMLVLAMKETVEMMDVRDMSGLATFWEQCICWTRGRLGLAVTSLLGPDKLPVLSPKSRFAELYMTQAHQEDHRRDAGDTLFRSRKLAWVVKGRHLAEKVETDCGYCKINIKKTMQQQMGDLPKEKFEIPCKPFTNLCGPG
jgi:hypothetical protein